MLSCISIANQRLIVHRVIAISITRLIYFIQLDVTGPDVSWNFVDPGIWTGMELNLAIVSGKLNN